jgi:DNA-3-methyladenine glycosylase
MRKILPKSFFNRDTHTVARELLGKFLVRKYGVREIASMITEVEIYDGPDDQASHARRGHTPRTSVMYGHPGHWYVYLIYGIYWLLNITTREHGYPAAILIRGTADVSGPGRLTKYFHINKSLNAKRAHKDTKLWIEDRGVTPDPSFIEETPRIGVSYAGDWAHALLRLVLKQW